MPYFRFPPHFKFSRQSSSKTDKPLSLLLLPEKCKKPVEGNRQAYLLIERGTQSKKKQNRLISRGRYLGSNDLLDERSIAQIRRDENYSQLKK